MCEALARHRHQFMDWAARTVLGTAVFGVAGPVADQRQVPGLIERQVVAKRGKVQLFSHVLEAVDADPLPMQISRQATFAPARLVMASAVQATAATIELARSALDVK